MNSISIPVPSTASTSSVEPAQKRSWRRIEKRDEKMILKGMREFRPLYLIAKDLGVCRANLYSYIRDKMNVDYKDMREAMLDVAESKLMQNIVDGNQNAIQFFLDRQGKNRGYGEKQQLDRNDVPTINIGTIKIENKEVKEEVIEVKEGANNE